MTRQSQVSEDMLQIKLLCPLQWRDKYQSSWNSTEVMASNHITYFKKPKKEDLKSYQSKKNISGNGYATCPKLIIIKYIHASKYHIISHKKKTQLLFVN